MNNRPVLVIDSQRLESLMACGRRYDYAFNRQLVPLITPGHFEKGGLMHEMLGVYYNLKKYRTRWATNKTTHEDVIKICVRVGMHKALSMSLSVDELDANIKTFVEYCRYYECDGWDQILSVEKTGSFQLYEDEDVTIMYELKPDLIVRTVDIPIHPIDHKTQSRRADPDKVSNQFMGYCYALKCNMLTVNQIGLQKTLKPEEKFRRATVSYPPDVLDEWRDMAVWWVKQLIEYMRNDFFPANYASCHNRYSGCIFIDVCSRERMIRDYHLQLGYKKREERWDVGKNL